MARPKTEKATYERVEVRMPPALLQAYRAYAEHEGRALNTQLVRSLQSWIEGCAAPEETPSVPKRRPVALAVP